MKFSLSSAIEYEVYAPTTFIFNIHAARTDKQVVIEEQLTIDPFFKHQEFLSVNKESKFIKLEINEKVTFKISYNAIVDLTYNITDPQTLLNRTPVAAMDLDIIQYLYPSRYCQSDRLEKLATKEFGNIENEYEKVTAISNWLFTNIQYTGGVTNSTTSAQDTLIERHGVCRDFAHLGIAFCRALSIPARYFSAYAYNLYPPDFHACFEAYIGGQWIMFDPTKLVPANGLVKIANGRDAADVSVATIFGETFCTYMNVNCQSLDPEFTPYYIPQSVQ